MERGYGCGGPDPEVPDTKPSPARGVAIFPIESRVVLHSSFLARGFKRQVIRLCSLRSFPSLLLIILSFVRSFVRSGESSNNLGLKVFVKFSQE